MLKVAKAAKLGYEVSTLATTHEPILNVQKRWIGATGLLAALTMFGITAGSAPVSNPAPLATRAKELALTFKINDNSFLIGTLFDKFAENRHLSSEDATRYSRIFALQDKAAFLDADAEIARLSDTRLMGHVLYQRYFNPIYKTSYADLTAWMKLYADHPGAQKIYDLALKKRPKAAALPPPPQFGRGLPAVQDFDTGAMPQPYLADVRLNPRQVKAMREIERLLSDSPTTALRFLDRAQAKGILNGTVYDAIQAEIAQSFFYNGKFPQAYEQAAKSAARSGAELPLAGWIAGLSAWRGGNYKEAGKQFAAAAESRRSSTWLSSASAYWAARASLRAHRPQDVGRWLERAAQYPRTFYGIIALKALGQEQARFDWRVPPMEKASLNALAAAPAGRRAVGLIDAGYPNIAAAELRQINPDGDEAMQEAMISFSLQAAMPDLALRMGGAFKKKDGSLYDAALYPDAPWRPAGGLAVDRALVHAFIRQESRFDTQANNRSSGASGLMQLMPETARIVARLSGMRLSEDDLMNPGANIALGQKYLEHLLKDASVNGNLFKLAVAYNAGPGKLSRWEKKVSYEDDPLLFVESIPVAETRIFVERVMANYWIYRIKYRQNTESLDQVAEGEWPVYLSQDIRRGSDVASASGTAGFMR